MNDRQEQIRKIRAAQEEQDWFFDRFDRLADKAFRHPGRSFALVAIINLLFIFAVIAAACFGLWLVFG